MEVVEGLQSRAAFSLPREILAGLTVSFVAISLGAAFGVQSERGALAGILSAGVIGLVTAIIGGTRIQCSGPTAPMTAVMLVMVSAVSGGLLADEGLSDVPPAQFFNLTLVLTGVIMLVAAALRLGRFIQVVPRSVISGFMNGIAVLIWLGEIKTLFGLGGKTVLEGGVLANLLVALATVLICFALPPILKSIDKRLASFLPATLVAIVLMTGITRMLGLGIERIPLGGALSSFEDFRSLVATNIPMLWSTSLVLLALPFAIQLAMLAYLDTLLTTLVIDKKASLLLGKKEETNQDQELAAQGIGNAVVSLIGGIPGAQATIRSVLILNEGARSRLAGILVGIFVLVEMVLFQSWIALIPKAVFSGILLKVGYDVFDWQPLRIYVDEVRTGMRAPLGEEGKPPLVSHLDMFFILGTTLVTVLVNLNVAVVAFTVIYYAVHWGRSFASKQEQTSVSG